MSILDSTAAKVKASLTRKFNEAKKQKPGSAIPQLALRDLKNLNRPAPSWRWNLVMPSLPGVSPAKSNAKKSIFASISRLVSKDPQALQLVCESISIPPTINLGRQDRYFNGHQVAFPGLPSYETVSAIFYEDEQYNTMNYFRKWFNIIYDPKTQIYGVPADYGKSVEFIALPVTNYDDVARYAKITLITCWPIAISKLSYGNTTDRIRVEVEFAFHRMETSIMGGLASSESSDLGSLVNSISKWRS